MSAKNIIIGQKVDSVKIERARELRRAMTPEEKTLWRHLRTNQLRGFHFRRQQVIDGFIADFYCHATGLIVELDRNVHLGQPDYDEERDRVLSARGLRVLRFRNNEVRYNLGKVLNQILAACQGQPNP